MTITAVSPVSVVPITSERNKKVRPLKFQLLEKFHSQAKNSADMTDTILVPRTIFKGYLGIMTGTTLVTIGSLLAKSLPKVSRFLSITGLITSLYGTYAFVRPYIIKDAPGVLTKKD